MTEDLLIKEAIQPHHSHTVHNLAYCLQTAIFLNAETADIERLANSLQRLLSEEAR